LNFESENDVREEIEARLFSNEYYDFKIMSVNTVSGTIKLVCEKCGNEEFTKLKDIEDGTFKCSFCENKKEKERLEKLADQEYVSKEVSKRHLKLISIDEDNYYIKCEKCGAEYKLGFDFELNSPPWDMCCKSEKCIYDYLESGGQKVKYLNLDTCDFDFTMDMESATYDADCFIGITCEACKKESVYSIKNIDKHCVCCNYSRDEFVVDKYDELTDVANIICNICGQCFSVSCKEVTEETVVCPHCHFNSNNDKITDNQKLSHMSARIFLAEYWGKEFLDVVDQQKTYPMSIDDFFKKCTACGGNYGAMLLTGIEALYPEVYKAIPNNMGQYSWRCICDTLELLQIK